MVEDEKRTCTLFGMWYTPVKTNIQGVSGFF
jgi:hypothetical protein